MSNSAKILKIVFVILLLVTVGELAYYVYIQFSIKNDQVSKNQNTAAIVPKDLLQGTTSEEKQSAITFKRPTDALLSEQNLLFLGKMAKNSNQKLYLKTITTGLIGGINESSDGKNLIVRINDDRGNKIMNYVWSKEKTDGLVFYKVEDEKNIPITIKDLKVNDKIRIDDEHNVSDSTVTINVTIQK